MLSWSVQAVAGLLESNLLSVTWSISFIQLGGEGGSTTTNETYKKMKLFLRASAVLILPISSTFPSVSELVCVYV